MNARDPIDAYIEALARRLHVPAIESHRTLLEIEDHLRDSASELTDQGLEPFAAQREALARFGTVTYVAGGLNGHTSRSSLVTIVRALLGTAAQLVATVFVVIGAGALVAVAASLTFSPQAVFGLPIDAVAGMHRCTHWLALEPGAATCQQAATLEAARDTPATLGALGIIGVLVLAVTLLLRRRGTFRPASIPPTLAPAIATSVFTVVAVALFFLGQANAVIEHSWGQGVWYSESACALIAAVISGILLLRVINRPFRGATA
jgi:hypothetical protein